MVIWPREGGAEVASRNKKSMFTLRRKDSIIVVNKGDPRLTVRVQNGPVRARERGKPQCDEGRSKHLLGDGSWGQGDGLTGWV